MSTLYDNTTLKTQSPLHWYSQIDSDPTPYKTSNERYKCGVDKLFHCARVRGNLIGRGDDIFLEELLRDVFGDILRIFEHNAVPPAVAENQLRTGLQDKEIIDAEALTLDENSPKCTAARFDMIN